MKTVLKKIVALSISLFVFFSCNDDNLYDQGGGDDNSTINEQYGMGLVFASEEEWSEIPLLTYNDILQLPNLTNAKNKKVIGETYSLDALEGLPRFHQGAWKTCASSSIAYALALVYRSKTGMPYKSNLYNYHSYSYTVNGKIYNYADTDGPREFSVAYLHYNTKKREGFSEPNLYDKGDHIPNIIRTLIEKGVPTACDWPYFNAYENAVPDHNIDNKARHNKLYSRKGNALNLIYRFYKNNSVNIINELELLLDKGYPIVFGMSVPLTNNYFRGGHGIYGVNQFIEDRVGVELGGHAMTIVGYNKSERYFVVLNSWGEAWGDNGTFKLAYDIIRSDITRNNMVTIVPYGSDAYFGSSSKLCEFTGYKDYKGVSYSSNGITIGDVDSNDEVSVKIGKEGYIQYPMDKYIPRTGTLEIKLKVDKLYSDKYTEDEKMLISSSDDTAPVLSTLTMMLGERFANPVITNSTGAMQLRISKDGKVWVLIADGNLDDALKNLAFNPLASGTNIKMYTSQYSINIKEWNRIGLSFGSKGLTLKINNNPQENFGLAIELAAPHNKEFTIGYTLSNYAKWLNNYNPSWSIFPKGDKSKTFSGFEGYVQLFRTSDTQQDWVISK